MKLKDLTKEQRVSIKSDELGNYIIYYLEDKENLKISVRNVVESKNRKELQRTIKRIDDEILFLDFTDIHNSFNINIDVQERIRKRIKELEQQKELYELMEQLE